MSRVYNFSAGPSMLPLSVLEKVQKELLCYGISGQSVMEMSHRSAVYDEIFQSYKEKLTRLLNIPQSYQLLFIAGGASVQFDMVPQNLLCGGTADYITTGEFSAKAYAAAKELYSVTEIASSKDRSFAYIPEISTIKFNSKAKYIHICQNNTIFGTRFTEIPSIEVVPLVSDMSSCILSEPIQLEKYGLIYAGAQKNMAPAGFAVVIARKDLIGNHAQNTPIMQRYSTYAQNDSMYNTPTTFSLYVGSLVADWLQNEMGGLLGIKQYNEEKAAIVYDTIDNSRLFINPADKKYRSLMNITFKTKSAQLDDKFCSEAAKNGLVNLKGHRLVGGMRASIYNAMPKEGVLALVNFMKKFESENI